MKTYYILGTVLDTDYSDSKRGKQSIWLTCSRESQKLEWFLTKRTTKKHYDLANRDENKDGKNFKTKILS